MSDSDKRTTCDKLKCYIQGSFDFTLLRKTTFLLFCITGILQKFAMTCYVPHIVNWALAGGVPRYLAVWAVSTLSCVTTACRIVVSLIADRKWANRFIIFACGLFFEFLMCIPPLVYPGIIGTYISVIMFGLQSGLLLSRTLLNIYYTQENYLFISMSIIAHQMSWSLRYGYP